MASGLELVPYSCADFSMSIPDGWAVEAATSNAGMYHALRAYDPACSVNQILYILKAEPLFVDDFLKQNYTYWNDAYAAFPVMAEESVKGYFDVLPQYVAAVAEEPFYRDLHLPQYENFTVTETFDATGSLGGTAGVLRAEFTQDGIEAEGMCSVELVPFPIPGLGGYYMAYSTTIVSAEKGCSELGGHPDAELGQPGLFRQLHLLRHGAERCGGAAISAVEPVRQRDAGRYHVLVGKPEHQSGHHQSEAERRHHGL